MKPQKSSVHADAIHRTARTIDTGLGAALDPGALAAAARLSRFHCHRMFRGLAGETPLRMHRLQRLERAATKLLETDAPVIQIAFDAGFETYEAFSRRFRATYGCRPSRFRQSRDPEAPGVYTTCRQLLPTRTTRTTRTGIHFTTPAGSLEGLLAPLFIIRGVT